MSKSQRLQNAPDKAKEQGKKYRWLEAAELYEQALHNAGKQDFLNRGKIKERIACCFNRAAFQAESQEEFKRKILQAIEYYEDAENIFEKMTDGHKEAGNIPCRR